MATLEIQSETREHILVPTSAKKLGVAYDPTADVVEWSFPPKGEDPVTWVAGSWEQAGTKFYAAILVSGLGGGGDAELEEGVYDYWVRVTDNPERPVRKIGQLKVK